MHRESLGTRCSRATGIIGVTQDLVDGRICILANTQLLVSIRCDVHTIWAKCSSRAGPRRRVIETWSLGQGGRSSLQPTPAFRRNFWRVKNPTRLPLLTASGRRCQIRCRRTRTARCLRYDDVRHWCTGSTGKRLRDKWHWHGQCGAVAKRFCYIQTVWDWCNP